MKKSLKFMTAVAVTVTSLAMTQSTVVAMSSLVDIFPSVWASRTFQEIRQSIEQSQQTGIYIIQWGDTLSTISQATGISIQELSALNNIADINLIIAGSTLYMDYTNHTITYAAPSEDSPITVSTETGEVVETPMEVFNQVIEMDSMEQIIETTTEEWNVLSTDEQQMEASVSSSESLVANNESSVPEVTVAEEIVNEITPSSVTTNPEESDTSAVESEEGINPTTQGTPITVEATAYSYREAGLSNFTADGTDLTQDSRVIAVDPSVIPLGTMVYIPGYGTYRAADTGGAIVGNKIDIHFNTVEECYQFGRQQLTIYILK